MSTTTAKPAKKQYASVFEIPLPEIMPVLIGDNKVAKGMLEEILVLVKKDFGSLKELVLKINTMTGSELKSMLNKGCGQEFVDAFVFALETLDLHTMQGVTKVHQKTSDTKKISFSYNNIPCQIAQGEHHTFEVTMARVPNAFRGFIAKYTLEMGLKFLMSMWKVLKVHIFLFNNLKTSSVLLLGEGDLSFSTSLLSNIQNNEVWMNEQFRTSHLLVTTYGRFSYNDAQGNKNLLEKNDIKVVHNIDATSISKVDLEVPNDHMFSVICFNNPMIEDSRSLGSSKMKLVKDFIAQAYSVQNYDGRVFMILTTEPYDSDRKEFKWRRLRSEYAIHDAIKSKYICSSVEDNVCNRYPGYKHVTTSSNASNVANYEMHEFVFTRSTDAGKLASDTKKWEKLFALPETSASLMKMLQ